MPTFSRSLEQSLHRALALANERHHEYATLEHLLLALIEDQDAAAVMRACNVDLEKLRRRLVAYLELELDNLVTDRAEDFKPTAGFQRVIQRAVIHVQSSGREEVRTSATTSELLFARAPCGDVTWRGGIPGVPIGQYADRHDRHASDSQTLGYRRLET